MQTEIRDGFRDRAIVALREKLKADEEAVTRARAAKCAEQAVIIQAHTASLCNDLVRMGIEAEYKSTNEPHRFAVWAEAGQITFAYGNGLRAFYRCPHCNAQVDGSGVQVESLADVGRAYMMGERQGCTCRADDAEESAPAGGHDFDARR